MDCSRARELIHSRLDGTISADERRELLSHLEICAECAGLADELSGQQTLLRSLMPPARPVDMTAIMRERNRLRAKKVRRTVTILSASAAALVVCIGSYIFLAGGFSSSAPKADYSMTMESMADEAEAAAETLQEDAPAALAEEECAEECEEAPAAEESADTAVPNEERGEDLLSGSVCDSGAACSQELFVEAELRDAFFEDFTSEEGRFEVYLMDGGDFSVYIGEDNMQAAMEIFRAHGIEPVLVAGNEIYIGAE